MMITAQNTEAQEETSVKTLYEDVYVAEGYIKQRFGHAWGKLLHSKQVAAVNRVIEEAQTKNILEIAPGPARLATELKGVRHGLMIDNSAAMLTVAQHRLEAAGIAHLWQLQKGNAFELEKIGQKFSFVFTFRFIRHFRQDERGRLYSSIGHCLEPRGLLLFDVVNKTIRQQIDLENPVRPKDELNVFDETYSSESFADEMRKYGFRVLRCMPILNHFFLQSWISHRLGYRLPGFSSALVRSLEVIPSREPLEWIALCQKTG